MIRNHAILINCLSFLKNCLRVFHFAQDKQKMGVKGDLRNLQKAKTVS